MKWLIAFVLTYCGFFSCPARSAASPFPRLLPPASDLHLVMREDPRSRLPLGLSCSGEAGLTLTCRAFTLTLENASQHTIHLSGLACEEPAITIERKEPRSSSRWWPVSWPGESKCAPPLQWTNLRLMPGERTGYATRLIAPHRQADSFVPGSYTLRATWVLFGCTEVHEGTDCLASMQVIRPPSSIADVAMQEPVTLLSNEVRVDSPPLPDLGVMRFSFEVSVRPGTAQTLESGQVAAGCATGSEASIDCIVFHYTIRNIGDRTVRNATLSCSDSGITPEYQVTEGEWKTVPLPKGVWGCLSNVLIEKKILPGDKLEGEFTFSTLAPPRDTTVLRASGEHTIRFIFSPNACFASQDGSFCLMRPESQPLPVVSPQLTLRAP